MIAYYFVILEKNIKLKIILLEKEYFLKLLISFLVFLVIITNLSIQN